MCILGRFNNNINLCDEEKIKIMLLVDGINLYVVCRVYTLKFIVTVVKALNK